MQRKPMPASTVRLHCDVCDTLYAELSANTKYLAAAICAARREHAIAVHGWHP